MIRGPIEASGLKLFFEDGGEDEDGTVWLVGADWETLEEAWAGGGAVCIAVGPECLGELAEGLHKALAWYRGGEA